MSVFSDFLSKSSAYSFVVGTGRDGATQHFDFESSPHLLIAGATGTGKSVLLHNILLTLLAHNSLEKLRLVLCDTKIAELSVYNGVPHMLAPTQYDTQKIEEVLHWAYVETYRRLQTLSSANSRNFQDYNDYAWENFISDSGLPRILIVVDDVYSVISNSKDAIDSVQKIIQNGRLVGIHLIIVTQTPTLGVARSISLSIQNKVIFSVASKAESKALIGTSAAYELRDAGECIFSVGGGRYWETTVSMPDESDFESILGAIKVDDIPPKQILKQDVASEVEDESCSEESSDELTPAAVEVILETGQASVSMIQRRLNLGYARAARIMDEIEERGIVGPFDGSKPRVILVTREQWGIMQRNVPAEQTVQVISKVDYGKAQVISEVNHGKAQDNHRHKNFFSRICSMFSRME